MEAHVCNRSAGIYSVDSMHVCINMTDFVFNVSALSSCSIRFSFCCCIIMIEVHFFS